MNKRLLLTGSVRILTRYKLRSFFMSLGIVIGVAALVVMRSMGSGAEQDMMNKIERMFSAGSIWLLNRPNATHGGTRDLGKLTIDDIEAIGEQLENVIDWNPSATIGSREVQYQDRSRSLMIIGGSERAEAVSGRGVTVGEYFSGADVRSAARVALIGSKTAEALFDGENPVGKRIQIGNSPFRVKGVLEEHGVDPHGMDRDDEVHVPITTLMRRMLDLDTIGSAKLIISSTEEVDNTVEQVAELLRVRHGLADDEPDDFSIFTPTQVQQAVKKANRVLTVYLPATAGVALLVAAIVIANIMLIAVRERIPEIGLRKAVGATDRQIGGQFLLESLAVTVVSGVLGVGIGAGILVAVARMMSRETKVTPDSIVLGLGAALVVGILAGWLPARQAARQEPVDALR
jgi:putative ABC transport system permease protein